MSSPFKISSIDIINLNSLQIIFTDNWYQEDIPQLAKSILSLLENHKVLDQVSGGDRENCRFEWLQEYFMLNFEYYSQSCWIENETTPNIELLNTIKQHLEAM